ncbi:MAG TPA: chloride channel protein [Candidatus Binataceae bacterium]|nr:chloride channel protein [Candidatus Binataceae bacterium]
MSNGETAHARELPAPARWHWPPQPGTQLEYFWLIIVGALVGVLGALANLGFRVLIQSSSWLFQGVEWTALEIARGSWFVLLTPIVLLSGGVALLGLNFFFPGEVFGYGFPDFLVMLHLGRARVERRWIFIKAAGAAISLGAGASVGREGPIAQIGAAVGGTVAQLVRLPAERAKVLIACGAGAGIATTFNAPIGGLLFAQEIILLGELELSSLTLIIVATTAGVITSRAISGDAAVLHEHHFVLRSYWELLTYGVMGVALGLLSAFYIRFFHAIMDAFKRLSAAAWVKLAIGLSIVGLVAAVLPQNLSDGYPVIDQALAGELSIARMAVLVAAKIFGSSVSLGCGAPGGVFGPIFFIGAMAGGSFRGLSALLLPGLTAPRGSYALVGLGGFLSATSSAPLTALFLLVEMTQDYTIALPALITLITALAVARAIEPESIDTYALKREGKSLEIGKDRMLLAQISVAAVMTREPVTLRESDPLPEVLRVGGETSQSILPVVAEEGALTGVIVTRELLTLIGSGDRMTQLVNAFDIALRNFPTVTPDATLDHALMQIEGEGVEEIPVVDNEGRFLAIVTRHAIAQAFNRTTISLSALASREPTIQWSTGYRVMRIKITLTGEGKSLRDLDPRVRFGVSVLAVQEAHGGFIPIGPDRPFQSGDVIVAAGLQNSLRMFQREV